MAQHTNALGQPIGRRVSHPLPTTAPPREAVDGRYCRLEPLHPQAHGPSLFDAFAEDTAGRVWTYLPYGPFDRPSAFRTWLTAAAGDADTHFYAIVDRARQRALGVASYLRIAPQHGTIEVGHLNYGPALQRTTAATEAMYLMMRRAFQLGFRRYEWKCDALNAPSRAAAERLGFTFEGVFRHATVYKGRNRDTAWYAVIDDDWPRLQAAFARWLHPTNFGTNGRQRLALSRFIGRQPATTD